MAYERELFEVGDKVFCTVSAIRGWYTVTRIKGPDNDQRIWTDGTPGWGYAHNFTHNPPAYMLTFSGAPVKLSAQKQTRPSTSNSRGDIAMKTSYLETEIGNEIYSPVEIDIKKIKREISELRKEMEANGVRQISCFNAGLTSREYLYNSQLFCLKTKLAKISAQKQVEPSK